MGKYRDFWESAARNFHLRSGFFLKFCFEISILQKSFNLFISYNGITCTFTVYKGRTIRKVMGEGVGPFPTCTIIFSKFLAWGRRGEKKFSGLKGVKKIFTV